ncbi:hypothetical protein Scep_016721 [Stephania cephalantha]|uniref:DYW domain-containing protein n=1 Tax=Stephania cephalantha TaxID=152367 RepID=A0AAP0NTJ5_9MAGN
MRHPCSSKFLSYCSKDAAEGVDLHREGNTSSFKSHHHLYDHLLQSCCNLKLLKQIHSSLITSGFIKKSTHLVARIILKYSALGHPECARSIFNGIATSTSNSFLWNTMLRAYANGGHCVEALSLYRLMQRARIAADNYTFPFVLKATASRSLVVEGKMVHGDAIRRGLESDMFVEAALVDMYAKCGEVTDGRRIFDRMPDRDLVCWTAMITAYEQSERPEEALMLFWRMQGEEGLSADSVTAVSLASAVAQLGDLRKARSIHAHAIRNGFLEEDISVGNSIVAMYAKCSHIEEARLVFEKMKQKDGVSWNSMLSGYVQNGRASEALSLFDEMQVPGMSKLTSVTALIMVSACSYLGSRHLGKKLHDFIISSGMRVETTLWNAILDMYGKCGDLQTAVDMFNMSTPGQRNVSSWNVMISGYGMHGYGKDALRFYEKMQEEGFEPNHITFTSLLAACSHSGLVDEGRKRFQDMNKLNVKPEAKHYTCMVDMLGRAGLLDEALDLIKKMPLEPSDEVWGALLLACKIHCNAEMGEVAAQTLFHLQPEHTGYYVLMSNIYAALSKWQEVGMLRRDMKSRGLRKPAALSVIEFDEEVHGFHAADQTHPQCRQVHEKVQILVLEIKMAGYVPDRLCVLHDVEEEDKDLILTNHSEKLAVAFGIMRLEPQMPIYITKNLRVCNDCHSAFKFISQVHQRKIVVRDANRFHHFQDGSCSCNDYW